MRSAQSSQPRPSILTEVSVFCSLLQKPRVAVWADAPSEQAVLAAKLCLEGANTVGGALYFINPAACNGGWFNSSLTWVATIGDHVFYA